jgi:hypothetical protein
MVATISILDPESDPEDFEPDRQANKLRKTLISTAVTS